jgi:HK97 family phage major capsid protein
MIPAIERTADMAGATSGAADERIRRLEEELKEKTTFYNSVVERANAANRDLTKEDSDLLVETRGRMQFLTDQLENLLDIEKVSYESRNRIQDVGREIESLKGRPQSGTVEYRSAGEWALDTYKSHLGDRDATEKLEMYYRAAAHQKTSDNLGVVPDPIVGDVVNFIDAARPLVSALGPRPLPSSTWHRPVVTQHTAVAVQGSAGAAADEKTELVSQKMTIGRLTANAVTYGGYVNVSRQNIDFSQPSVMDIIINDLAAQYAIETEQATAPPLRSPTT